MTYKKTKKVKKKGERGRELTQSPEFEFVEHYKYIPTFFTFLLVERALAELPRRFCFCIQKQPEQL